MRLMDALSEMKCAIDDFARERDWEQFHTPANLAKSIAIESGELLECFQWNEDEFDLAQVKEELADVLNYCMRLASVLDLDVRQIVLDKIEKNRAKYPIEKVKGRSVKYDRL